jgi:D-glycero-alpha-D-manno-heptose-7-phosphate kinase
MIISKTPYRISFFGGGTDYPEWYMKNGGKVLSTTIDKYLYITCRFLPPFFKHKHRISYSKIEEVNNHKNIKHKVIKNVLELYLPKKKIPGLEIHYDGDLPSRSGMGSSSCFVVGMINLLNQYFKKKTLTKKELANISINFEQKIIHETVGIQDQIATSYGGFNKIIINEKGDFNLDKIFSKNNSANELMENIYLVFTGINRTAQFIAESYIHKLNDKNKDMHEIIKHVDIAYNYLRDKNYDNFGYLLNETWMIKKNLSHKVSNPKINDIYNLGIKSGAYGGKLLGAGGGGFILFYVPKKNQKKFQIKFKDKFFFKPKSTFEGSIIKSV